MKDFFGIYLNKFFKLYYLDYPKGELTKLKNFFPKIEEILVYDIKSKHPSYDAKEGFSPRELSAFFQIDTTIEAVFLYRLEREIFLNEPKHQILPYLANLMKIKTNMELYYSTEIGRGLNIQHGMGIVIGPRNKIGDNFIIHQGVTIGQKNLGSPEQSVVIGDDVIIFAGAKIIGKLKIGNNVQIGANAVLTKSTEDNAVYAGVPAIKIKSISG